MVNKIMLSFLVLDFLFVATGGLLLGTVFITKASMAVQPTKANVAANMLIMQTPLTGGQSLHMLLILSLTFVLGVIVNGA